MSTATPLPTTPTHDDVIGALGATLRTADASELGRTEGAQNLAGPMAAIMAAKKGQSVEQMRAASRAARAARGGVVA